MKEYLYDIGIKNSIEGIQEGHPNIFVNNSMHSKFSQYEDYINCGQSINAPICSKNKELECFSHGCCLRNDDN